jgi:hypothetical protein
MENAHQESQKRGMGLMSFCVADHGANCALPDGKLRCIFHSHYTEFASVNSQAPHPSKVQKVNYYSVFWGS